MAFVTEFTCQHCGQPRHEVVTPSRICATCRTALDKVHIDAHMAKLATLPIEERIRRIELTLYKLDAESRLKALEAQNARY